MYFDLHLKEQLMHVLSGYNWHKQGREAHNDCKSWTQASHAAAQIRELNTFFQLFGADFLAHLNVAELAYTGGWQAVDAHSIAISQFIFSLRKEGRWFERFIVDIDANALLVVVKY